MAADLAAACGDPVDIGYLDPAECYYVYGQAPPSAQGHSGYWADPRVWAEINRVAAGLPSPNGSASGSQPSVPPPELFHELVQAPRMHPADLAQRAVELPVEVGRVWEEGDTVEE